MKKVFSVFALVLLVVVLGVTMIACSGKKNSADGDLGYVQNSGRMVIGITYYEPMNYLDNNGNLVGFETEFAKAVCAKLGVEAKFQVINWDTKEAELKNYNIDCIWNGVTVTDERRENMTFSTSYMKNAQCIVVKNGSAYTDIASLAGAKLAFEKGSVGEEAVMDNDIMKNCALTKSDKQASALLELASNNVDAAIIDLVMASATVGKGAYADYKVMTTFANEEYAIAFRKGSNLAEAVNAKISEMIADGSLKELATKYGIQAQLI